MLIAKTSKWFSEYMLRHAMLALSIPASSAPMEKILRVHFYKIREEFFLSDILTR